MKGSLQNSGVKNETEEGFRMREWNWLPYHVMFHSIVSPRFASQSLCGRSVTLVVSNKDSCNELPLYPTGELGFDTARWVIFFGSRWHSLSPSSLAHLIRFYIILGFRVIVANPPPIFYAGASLFHCAHGSGVFWKGFSLTDRIYYRFLFISSEQ